MEFCRATLARESAYCMGASLELEPASTTSVIARFARMPVERIGL